MQVFIAIIVVIGSVSARGSGPYLPSGWRPQGPAFYLPFEVAKPADSPVEEPLIQETEASGSDALREYGPPKLEVALNVNQDLPNVATEYTFFVEAKNEEVVAADDETVKIEASNEQSSIIEDSSTATVLQNAEEAQDEEQATEISDVTPTAGSQALVLLEKIESTSGCVQSEEVNVEVASTVAAIDELTSTDVNAEKSTVQIVPTASEEEIVIPSAHQEILRDTVESTVEANKAVVSLVEQELVPDNVSTALLKEVVAPLGLVQQELVQDATFAAVVDEAVVALTEQELIKDVVSTAVLEEPVAPISLAQQELVHDAVPIVVADEAAVVSVEEQELVEDVVSTTVLEETVAPISLAQQELVQDAASTVVVNEAMDSLAERELVQDIISTVVSEETFGPSSLAQQEFVQDAVPTIAVDEAVVSLAEQELIQDIVSTTVSEETVAPTSQAQQKLIQDDMSIADVTEAIVLLAEPELIQDAVSTAVLEESERLISLVQQDLVEDVVPTPVSQVVVDKLAKGDNNIAAVIVNSENSAKTVEVLKTIENLAEIDSIQKTSGFLDQAAGFLEYGPPGFAVYGPPNQEDLARLATEETSDNETNMVRRRRFSPKFRSAKKH